MKAKVNVLAKPHPYIFFTLKPCDVYTFLMLISVGGRPISEKCILLSLQVTATPELETALTV